MEASSALLYAPVDRPERALPPVLRRNVVLGIALGVPLSAGLLYLAARNLDAGSVRTALDHARPLPLVGAVLAMALVYALQAARWHWIARTEAALPTRKFAEYVVASVACNNVVPGRPGDFLRAHWLARAAGCSRTRALATVVVDRASDVLALLVLLVVSFGATQRPGWLARIDLLALGLGVVICAVLLAARRYARRRAASEGVLAASRLGRLAGDLLETMATAVNRRDASVVAGLSLAAWAAWAGSAWLVASSLGIELGVFEVAFLTAVLNLGVAIPSSPGFVGTYQWLCVGALGLLAVGRADAFAFSVLMQGVWFVPTTMVGAGLVVRAGARRFAGRASVTPALGSNAA